MTFTGTRVAIVTGAAQGIGRAIALRLAQDGLDVVVADLPSKSTQLDDLVTEIEAKDRKSLSVPTDVSVEEQVENLVRVTVSSLGGLDVMVANAGIAPVGTLMDTNLDEFNRAWSVNVQGTLLCYRHAAKVMIEQKRGGRIIGACSFAGKKGAYCATKAAVRSLTQTAATEFGKHGITVNAYAPGPVDTSLTSGMIGKLSTMIPSSDLMDVTTAMASSQPLLGRTGVPEDVSNLVSFIASKDSAFITGQSMTVDGGMWFD
ncbi:hypothetical protein SERLADRAFT_439717 [Serpula lacrymans var. lacrymans S7.9]|uniref:Uncharacterized protein n=1 Tax=Serpula lacrymans var. lacrymans (strain S7.9) TaxID=578457 RepID=F8P1B5_SERL9|nr:uncharacterized protein SERLADRAFT_439717 [Serpula lacrymans var. lacrymans S7.9]EGO22945.1 hypothetical protein SERLADRAFT_439717 [Serpula lacrymans var. lacrymans S7.9]